MGKTTSVRNKDASWVTRLRKKYKQELAFWFYAEIRFKIWVALFWISIEAKPGRSWSVMSETLFKYWPMHYQSKQEQDWIFFPLSNEITNDHSEEVEGNDYKLRRSSNIKVYSDEGIFVILQWFPFDLTNVQVNKYSFIWFSHKDGEMHMNLVSYLKCPRWVNLKRK